MTDAALLTDYATRKDAEAFAQLVTRYQRLIFSTCRRVLYEPQDTDDAVQETFLRLATRAGELHSNLGAWLHQCAITVSIDLNRRRDARRRHESTAAKPVIVPEDPQKQLAELREHLDAALEQLEPDDREVIVQRFFVGRPQTELAAEAGVAPSTISARLDRAIEALRQQLGQMNARMLAAAGATALGGLLDSEHASAAVPAQLTANVMKIGLTGASAIAPGTSGVSLFSSLAAKLLLGLAAILFLAGGIWILRDKTTAPATAAVPATAPSMGATIPGITGGAIPDTAVGAVAPSPAWAATQPATQPAVLSGRIVDQKGNPVPNATVTLSGGYPVKSDANGYYAFRTIRINGQYLIGVEADGFMPIRENVDHEPGVQISANSQARRDIVLQRGAVIHVTVNDLLGAPVPNAHVHVSFDSQEDYGRSRQEKPTSANGIATFTVGVSKTAYNVFAWMKDREPVHEIVTIDSADQPKNVTLALLPSTPVKGIAICSDGKPGSGWTVSAAPQWWIQDTIPRMEPIDKDGNFTLNDVGPGIYNLMVWKKSGGTQVATVKFPPASQPFRLDLPYESPGSLVTLSGRVRVTGGRPQYLMVEAMNESTNASYSDNLSVNPEPKTATQPAGYGARFELSDMTPGKYRLMFSSTEIETKVMENVEAPGELPTVQLKMVGKPRLRGTVVDGTSGQPIRQFAVRALKTGTLGEGSNYSQDDRWVQVSDAKGNFAIELAGPGIYKAQVSAEGFAWTFSDAASVDNSGQKSPLIIKVLPGGAVAGQVVDPSGTAVAGARVIPLSMTRLNDYEDEPHFNGAAGSVVADAQGHFLLAHLAAGEESLKIVAEHLAPRVFAGVKVIDQQTTDAGAIKMLSGGTVEGTVYDAAGHPMAGAPLRFSDNGSYGGEDRNAGLLGNVTTDGDGHYRMEHLPQKLVYVDLEDRSERNNVTRRVVRPVDGKTAQLDLGGTTPITGRFLLEGKPSAATTVELAIFSEYFGPVLASARTRDDGRFTFFGMPPGVYLFNYRAKNDRADWVRVSEVTVSPQTKDLGDVAPDFGNVSIVVQADDPADSKVSRHLYIEPDVADDLFPPHVGNVTPDGAGTGRWSAANVPAGRFRVHAHADQPGQAMFSTPFERMPGAADTPVVVHIPHASSQLTVNFIGEATAMDQGWKSVMLTDASSGVGSYLRTKTSDPVVVALPPGTYRALIGRTSRPRTDISPIELKAGDAKTVNINVAPPLSDRLRSVQLCAWNADGLPLFLAAIHLTDDQGLPINSSSRAEFGPAFQIAPGHYRATVDAPGSSFTTEFDVSELKKWQSKLWLPIQLSPP